MLKNASGGTPTEDKGTELEGNLIGGLLLCFGNTPAPTNGSPASPNTVSGPRLGQTCTAAGF